MEKIIGEIAYWLIIIVLASIGIYALFFM